MRIAMLASTYPRYDKDGAGRFNLSIAEALANLGHDVHVVMPYSPLIKPFDTPVKIHVFHYIWPDRLNVMGYAQAMRNDRRLKGLAPLLAPMFFLMGVFTLWQIVRKFQIDVIHAHWVIPNGFMAATVSRLTGKPLFISLHGSDIFFARRHKSLGLLAAWAFRQATAVTACSPHLVEGATTLGISAEKLHLLPWGADPAYFVSPPDRVDHLRAKLGLELENRVLLGLGRLVGKKGFANLVAAYASLRPQFADARLVIVGDGPEMGSLQDQTVALGVAEGVVFAGQADWTDVPAYLALADVFVAPSVYDNGNVDALPTVILEAMAAGKPVVASRIVGIPLVVKEGVNGFLVKENDVPALAEALKQVLDSEELRTRLGRMGRRMIEEWLNWRNVARSFIDLYCGRKPLLEDHLKVG